MHKTINTKNNRLIFIYVFLVVIFMYQFLSISGIILGANIKSESLKKKETEIAYRENTVEGDILDSKGSYIFHDEKYYFNTAYSYIVGYNSLNYGEYGLRGKFKDYLLYKTHDNKGSTMTLTTDNLLQTFCYDLLKEKGSIIILDNNTAAIRALASRAEIEFDIENFGNMSEYNKYDGFFLPTATSDQDPPGSTFKIITSASALENEKSDFCIEDNGRYTLPTGGSIVNYGAYPNGNIGIKDAFKASSNVYFSKLGLILGKENLEKTASDFLIGENIELDFTTIKSSYGQENSEIYKLATMSFGQGDLQVTPLHLAMIVQSIKNNGTMLKPYLIENIELNNKNLYNKKIEEIAKPISSNTANSIKEYMEYTASANYNLAENIGVKTGTAELGNGFNHTYIVGYTEYYTIVISKNETTETSSGLMPDFKKIVNFLNEYYPVKSAN